LVVFFNFIRTVSSKVASPPSGSAPRLLVISSLVRVDWLPQCVLVLIWVWLLGTRPAAEEPAWGLCWLFSCLPGAAVFLCMCLPPRWWRPCLCLSLHGPWVVGHLFDSCGKLFQGLASLLGHCFQLTAVRCGQVLVPKAVLKCLDDFIRSLFRYCM
jgi:hypothetical protein